MELRTLRYFIAVAESGNIGRAATRLRIAQPPLTRQIQALEGELGAQLFIRTPRGVVLTQAGEALLRDARTIAMLVAQAAERTRRAGRGEVGILDVGIFGSAVLDLVPRLLAAFNDDYPDVQVVLHHAAKEEQVQALRHGRVLVAFDRDIDASPDIVTEIVAREPVLVALPARHRLARRAAIPIGALRDVPLIGGTSARHDPAPRLFSAAGFTPVISQEVGDVMTAVALIASGMGLGIVPASARNLRIPGVVFRPLEAPDAQFELQCCYRRADPSPLLATFLHHMRASVARMAPTGMSDPTE